MSLYYREVFFRNGRGLSIFFFFLYGLLDSFGSWAVSGKHDVKVLNFLKIFHLFLKVCLCLKRAGDLLKIVEFF